MVENTTALITTIIPTYKRPKLLQRALASALNQSFSSIWVQVYDNGADDETKEIVKNQKDSRVTYFAHPIPLSATQNLKFALSRLKTPFFSILSDDDLLGLEFYQTALSTLSRFNRAAFFLGSTIDIESSGKILGAKALSWKGEYFEPPKGLNQVIPHYFNWTGALFRTEVLKSVQIDEEVIPIDFDFVARLAAIFPFAISKKPCALFISHPASYSAQCGLILAWPSWIKITHNLQTLVPYELFPKVKKLLDKRLGLFLVKTALLSLKKGNHKEVATIKEILKQKKKLWSKKTVLFFKCVEKNRWLSNFIQSILCIFRMRKWRVRLKYCKFVTFILLQYGNKENL